MPSVVPGDPDDDLIIAIAVLGRADVICTLDRHFYQSGVQEHGAGGQWGETVHRVLGDVGKPTKLAVKNR